MQEPDSSSRQPKRGRRLFNWLNLGIFLLSLIAIAGSITAIAQHPDFRQQVDATKTRAYSLSEQTTSMLNSLEGDWQISVVLIESEVDRATLRQVDEVLNRYAQVNADISVQRIDPTRQASIEQYATLLDRLKEIYHQPIADYELAVQNATSAYEKAVEFAGNEAAQIQAAMKSLPDDAQIRPGIQAVFDNLALLARSGGEVINYINNAMATSETTPVPDYEAARDVAAEGLRSASHDMQEMSELFTTWAPAAGLPTDLRNYLAAARLRMAEMAIEMQTALDPLIHDLEPLRLTKISEELERGEAAVITSPTEAAVIPAAQLFPKSNLKETRQGGITFDQRFRGEQLISSTIQSMLVDHLPLVVFVHAEPKSILEAAPNRNDYAGAAALLAASGFEVQEWPLTQLEAPRAEPGQPTVFVFIQPTPGGSLELSKEGQMLIQRLNQLIGRGESILASGYPSANHKMRQPDPWQGHFAAFGIDFDTSRVVFETGLDQAGETYYSPSVRFVELTNDHPVALATSGQLLQLPVSIPITVGDALSGVQQQVVVELEPGNGRYLVEDWVMGMNDNRTLPDGDGTSEVSKAVPHVVAASRPHPMSDEVGSEQRIMLVGSGAWLQSSLADQVIGLGGERMALAVPGNYQLFQASVAWLAGMDELIAQSATSQQVARLDGITPEVRTRWQWIAMAGLPLGCLLFGCLVWLVRKI